MTTRADYEAELVSRLGRWMAAAGMDGTTVNGTNADLTSPLNYALRDASASAITDVSSSALDRLYDVAEWRLLENIVQNYTKVDVSAGPVSAKQDNLGQRMERRFTALRAYLATTYGLAGAATLSTGVLTLDMLEPET